MVSSSWQNSGSRFFFIIFQFYILYKFFYCSRKDTRKYTNAMDTIICKKRRKVQQKVCNYNRISSKKIHKRKFCTAKSSKVNLQLLACFETSVLPYQQCNPNAHRHGPLHSPGSGDMICIQLTSYSYDQSYMYIQSQSLF